MVDVVALDDLPPHDPDFVACGKEDSAEQAVRAFGFTNVPATVTAVTRLVSYLKKWGVKYRLVAGYETRGRPSGGFGPRGYLIHHTASTSSASNPNPSLRTVVEGRSDLPGPLCQVATDYNGVTDVVALGRANHAGAARAFGAVPSGDGNELWLGNEVMTSGTQRMPAVQRDAVIRVGAAVMDMLGVTPAGVAGHVGLHASTSVTGKWDLGAGTGQFGVPIPLAPIHTAIAALLAAGPGNTTGGFLMALSDTRQDDVAKKIDTIYGEVKAVNVEADARYGVDTGREGAMVNRILWLVGKVDEVDQKVAAQDAKLDAILAAVQVQP